MHEAGLVVEAEAQRLGQSVDMPQLAAAALRRQARRLVQGDQVIVTVKHGGAHHVRIRLGHARMRGRQGCLVRQRGNANGLARLDAGRGLGAGAVDADLALAAALFDPALRQLRKAPLQPPVEPLVALPLGDGDGLHATHAAKLRAKARPAKSAVMDSTTLAST